MLANSSERYFSPSPSPLLSLNLNYSSLLSVRSSKLLSVIWVIWCPSLAQGELARLSLPLLDVFICINWIITIHLDSLQWREKGHLVPQRKSWLKEEELAWIVRFSHTVSSGFRYRVTAFTWTPHHLAILITRVGGKKIHFKKLREPWLMWLSGLSAGCEPKGCWFDSLSGHMLGLWARSTVGAMWEAATHWSFFPSHSPSLPLSLKINK